MSSLRNAVKRITHKERSQPQARSHLGLLEKKKDYRLRSTDYHRKQARLKSMREKIANRNPDEFYFGMHNSKVDGMSGNNSGRMIKTEEARRKELEERGLGSDGVRIMKSQDLSYVRMQRLMDQRKVEKLQGSLHYLEFEGGGDGEDKDVTGLPGVSWKEGVGNKRKHTVFIEGGQEEMENFDVAKHFDTIPELVGRSFNRPRVQTLEKLALAKVGVKVPLKDADDDYYEDDESPTQKHLTHKQLSKQQKKERKMEKRIARIRSSAYSEMELRNERLAKLKNAEDHLVVQKNVEGKGRKRKIAGKSDDGKPAAYKWRRKRAK
ncbi:hypothetical protein ACHAXS_001026 [Conticribra weissflogii]